MSVDALGWPKDAFAFVASAATELRIQVLNRYFARILATGASCQKVTTVAVPLYAMENSTQSWKALSGKTVPGGQLLLHSVSRIGANV